MATGRQGAIRGHRLHHARRPGAGRHRCPRLELRLIETVCVASYDYQAQSGLQVLKTIAPSVQRIGNGRGRGVLLIDDLTDTGKTARLVREMLPDAHFATVYAKPAGAPLCDTFVTEVSQDTWIYFPWDLDLQYAKPISVGTKKQAPDIPS